MSVRKKTTWSLADLIDFEVAVQQSPTVESEVGRRIRENLRDNQGDEHEQRRWAFKEWLHSKTRGAGTQGAGERVITVTRVIAMILFVVTLLFGVALVRGLVTQLDGQAAINIWVFLAVTLGVQWLILVVALVTLLLLRYWIGGLGWLQEGLLRVVRKGVGQMSPEAWRSLVGGKGKQPSALRWRLTRLLQVGGIGFNLGLIGGLFGVLWFTEVAFYWETSLAQFGAESLVRLTQFLAAAWGGEGLSDAQVAGLRNFTPAFSRETGERGAAWEAFFRFIFMALLVWGLLPRVMFWAMAVWKERQALNKLEFIDNDHRKLWRDLCRVERVVSMEGLKDGVVVVEVGGIDIDLETIRPFLLQKLRVNPERQYRVGVLDQEDEREAWEAMREAPCGVVILVEGWDFSPKQMEAFIARMRREAGEKTVLRILVMGDGMTQPEPEEVVAWQEFVDDQRDPQLECLAFENHE